MKHKPRYQRYLDTVEEISKDDLKKPLEPYKLKLRIKPLVKFIGDISPTKKVLDVGCGDGVLMRELRKKGIDVYGIDVSKSYIEKLRKEGFNVELMDIETNTEFKSFDICILSMILEHVLNPDAVIDNVWCMKCQEIIIVVPYKENIEEEFKRCKYEFNHLRTFDLDILDTLMVGYRRVDHKIIVPKNPFKNTNNILLRKAYSFGLITFPELWSKVFVPKYDGEVLMARYRAN